MRRIRYFLRHLFQTNSREAELRRLRQSYLVTTGRGRSYLIVLPKEVSYNPSTKDILELAQFCPLCKDEELIPRSFFSKSCTNCAGEMYVTGDAQGLPVLAFTPSE